MSVNLGGVINGTVDGLQAAFQSDRVGTGFNAAPVYDTADGRYVPPSEAGHASLPVGDEDEFRLARHVARTHGFPEIEEVLALFGSDEHPQGFMNEVLLGRDPTEPRGLGHQVVIEHDVGSHEISIHLPVHKIASWPAALASPPIRANLPRGSWSRIARSPHPRPLSHLPTSRPRERGATTQRPENTRQRFPLSRRGSGWEMGEGARG